VHPTKIIFIIYHPTMISDIQDLHNVRISFWNHAEYSGCGNEDTHQGFPPLIISDDAGQAFTAD
jgi:hypothetical protein